MPFEFANLVVLFSAIELSSDAEPELMREVFGNISPAAKAVFYVVATIAMGVFCFGLWRRVRLWRLGRPSGEKFSVGDAARQFVRDVFLQHRVRGRGFASIAHRSLFWGFLVLLVGTILIAVEHILAGALGRPPTDPLFHKGLYYAVFEVILDAFGLVFLGGCFYFLVRRFRRPASLGHNGLDIVVLLSLIVIGVTGYIVEAVRIIYADTPQPGLSFAGYVLAEGFRRGGVDAKNATSIHFALWWVHAIAALGLIAAFPYTRLLHSLAGALNLSTAETKLGHLAAVTMEELEERGTVGVSAITDFDRVQLLQMDACVSCGRCEEVCPAHEAGKPLSPRDVVQDLRGHLTQQGPLLLAKGKSGNDGEIEEPLSIHGDTISAETLWSCTTCSACVVACPLGISPLGMITDLRRNLIAEAELRGAPAASLQKTQRSGNPWGLPAADRFAWADGLDVPTVADNPDFEILYWVGCAAAYDRRIQKVARSVVRLLKAADVNFAVLGPEERCTGESARRMGDEFLFQEMAATNVDTLSRHSVKKIITHCPHCLNSLKQDYSQFDGHYEVTHHSEFLNELVRAGKLPTPAGQGTERNVTYHDPCYLARVGGVTEAPRELVELTLPQTDATKSKPNGISEMPRNRENTSCCGAGGGRMWFDDAPEQRIGKSRVQEVLATGADTVAVSCPFCLVMMTDGIAATDQKVDVRDIAELLAESLELEGASQ